MEDLKNLIRREVALYHTGRATTRIGLIEDYKPDDHAAKVIFQPEGTISGWLPVGSARSGNGYGIHFAPQVGDQVMVHFLEGDMETGVIGMGIYSDVDRPLSVPAGELWAIHSTGSGLKLRNDGTAELISHTDLTVTIGGKLALTTAGDANLTIGGNMTANVSGTATIKAPTVNLGDTGGAAVARVGDSVSGGVITSGSTKVRAA